MSVMREVAQLDCPRCKEWQSNESNEQLRSDLRRLQTERDTLWAANQHLLAERDADREED